MTATQRRGRKIMMTTGEVDEFLTTQRTCRVATVSANGAPHVSALWYAWDGVSLWLYSVVRSKRWTDLSRDPRVAIVVDSGEEYDQLRGVELTGTMEFVGEVPRIGELCAELDTAETLFARKNFGLDEMPHDGRHAWARLTPDKIVSWDFSKLGPA
ncbi:pyridoxamine 5'-phosphate oxidase family protein [Streptomyces sp. NPDC001480]|uniref:pyridoxamine 5'-phosphate oxidase family protein n=1 Tax=Streptomyces sp. NPDC001480 TaxID=3364577 RepID=UPI0036A888C4